jgi:hypothetical protein
MSYLLGLALNFYPPDVCLLSSWDYRYELPAPSNIFISQLFHLHNIKLAPFLVIFFFSLYGPSMKN